MITKQERKAIKDVVYAWLAYDKVCQTEAEELKRLLDLKYKHGFKERKLWDNEDDVEEAAKLDERIDKLDETKALRLRAFKEAEAKACKVCGDWVAEMF